MDDTGWDTAGMLGSGLLSRLGTGLFVEDLRDGSICYVNDAMHELVGWPARRLRQQDTPGLAAAVAPDDRGVFLAARRRALELDQRDGSAAGHTTVEVWLTAPRRRRHRVGVRQWVARSDAAGRPELVAGLIESRA